MSRTRRRDGANYHYHWVLREYHWHPDGGLRPTWIEPKSAEGQRRLNRFHGDRGRRTLMLGPPKAYRKTFTRKMRSQQRAAVQRWYRLPVDAREPLLQANHRHSATYFYW